VECTGAVRRRRRTPKATKRCLLVWLRLPRGIYLLLYRKSSKISNTQSEAHTKKPPFADIRSDHVVVVRILNGERPRWSVAPAQVHDVSSGVKELSESCWNSDPARRPTAQEIVEALAVEISQDVIVPQVLQSSPIISNTGISALQEAAKSPTSFSHNAVTRDRVPVPPAADHRVNHGSSISKLSSDSQIVE
jgi:hypothetical protein